MPKQSGLGHSLYFGGTDLSGDTASGEISCPASVADVTNLTQSAMSRQLTTRDGQIGWATWFNPAGEHPVLKALPAANVVTTYVCGTDPVAPAAGVLAKQPDYQAIRGADGSLSFALQALSNGSGLDWGHGYTGGPARTDTSATTGSGVDDGASSATGLTAYLHALSFIGTSATVALEHSADNGVSDAWSSLLVFVPVTAAPSAQRIGTSATLAVKRYIRVRTAGTFTLLTFYVMASRFSLGDTGVGVAVDSQVFTSSGTWTKPPGVTTTFVAVIGGGGGGGRGLANNAALAGSSGGGGGAYSDQFFPSSALGATETVTVGAGGAGAPLGGSAGNGGVSKFGTIAKVTSGGGNAGLNASNSLRSGGTGGFGLFAGSAGGDGALSSFGGNGVTLYSFAAAGGGAGGGTDTVPTAYNGGSGGAGYQTALAGAGALGAAPGGNGGDAVGTTPNTPGGGQGGGGGASNIAGNAGNGGAGGIYGGGGGGGGSCKTGSTAGIGGTGAGGIIVVISW